MKAEHFPPGKISVRKESNIMSEQIIRYGIIGCGNIARGVHIPGIQAASGVEITAICDSDPKRLEQTRLSLGLAPDATFTDYIAMLDSGLVDAVSITTPNHLHIPAAMAAAQRGIPFACEKPLSVDAESAKPLYDLVNKTGTKNMVCFSYRFKKAARYARDLIAGGRIGKIRHIYVRYLQSWGNPEKDCPRVWRFDRAASGSGTLADLGSHMLDLVRFLTDEEYTRFTAQNGTFVLDRRSMDPSKDGVREPVDVDDYAHYFAQTTGGIAASFEISRNAFGRGNFQHIEIYGDRGALIYELEDDDSLEICEGADENSHTFRRLEIPQKYRVSQMQCFIDRLRGDEYGLGATVADGYENMLELDEIIRSSEEGITVNHMQQ